MSIRLRLLLILLLVTFALACSSTTDRNVAVAQTLQAQTRSPEAPRATPVAAIVKAAQANLRDKPALAGNVVGTVSKDDLLLLVTANGVGPWYRVRYGKDGPEVWIHGNNIALLYTEANFEAASTARTEEARRPRTTSPPTTSGRSYVNVDGVRVPSPVFSDTRPAGATARCRDGSYSFSQHRRGTCSHHGGVAIWY